jgi:hypothetical protein
MRRREFAFLLIGSGIGLAFASVAIAGFAFWSFHHMFILGIQWGPVSILLALPFLLVLVGLFILFRGKGEQKTS